MGFFGTVAFLMLIGIIYSAIWYIFSISVLTKIGCIVTLVVGGLYITWAVFEQTKIVLNILYILGAVVGLSVFVLVLTLNVRHISIFRHLSIVDINNIERKLK